MRHWCFLLLLGAALPAPSFAAEDDGSALLRKVAAASSRLTYSGVFVYRSGKREETSRIAHSAEGARARERIEVLDGSPREVLREGDEVKCFLPAEQLLIIESQSRRRGFPSVLPAGGGKLLDHYQLRRTSSGRVAGFDTQAVALEPRDGYRYGHELWIEPASGLLLKASMLDEKGEVLESIAFTQLRVGGPLEEDALTPKFNPSGVNVRRVEANAVRAAKLDWLFRRDVPGFRQTAVLSRPSREAGQDSVQVVFSDGLAAISVFLEPANKAMEDGVARIGPMHVYRRKIDSFQALVMGEVPAAAVQRLGDGIERRGR